MTKVVLTTRITDVLLVSLTSDDTYPLFYLINENRHHLSQFTDGTADGIQMWSQ